MTIISFIELNGKINLETTELFNHVIINIFIPFLIYTVVLGGVQSIIYSFLMEMQVNPKIKSNILVIIISSFLGALSTLLSGLATQSFLLFSIIGAVVGILVGIILRAMYVKTVNNPLH